jgi:peptidoglycan/LPS O-acetylase OafA/YrhL
MIARGGNGSESRRVALPHIPALDGVRGVAVIAVLLFHDGDLAGGFLGVDLFFALSGFLITSLLLTEGHQKGHIALGWFLARRARRLLPALTGLLLGVAAFSAAFADPADRAEIRAQAWAAMLYVPNWYAVFADRDYWALFRAPSPLQHTWSLGIEEQFCVIWPLALAALWAGCRHRTPRILVVASLLLAAASAAAMWILYDPTDTSRVYFGTDTRAAPLLLGAALAAWHAGRGPLRSPVARVLLELAGVSGAIGLAAAFGRTEGESPALYRGGFALFSVAAVALIHAAVHPRRGPLAHALSWCPLRWIGIISYGTYLWHWPVYLVLDPARTGLSSGELLVMRIAATLAVALVSYVFVERPILRGALSLRQWIVVGPAFGAATAAALLVGTAGPGPLLASVAAPDAVATPSAAGRARILVLGDSLAINLFQGLQPMAAGAGMDLTLGVKVGCNRYREAPPPDCPPPWAEQVAQLRPDVVLVIESGYWVLVPLEIGSQIIQFGPVWDEAWTAKRQAIIDHLIDAGARRVVFTTLPCFEPSWWQRQPRLSPENLGHANHLLSALAGRNLGRVDLIDLARYVCSGNSASSGASLRVDGIHFTPEGSEIVGRWLAPELARVARRAPSDSVR